MKNRIERFCEECQVRLLTKAHHDRCFDKNHNIRVNGMFTVIDSDGIIRPQTLKEYLDTPIGIVTHDAKKGELMSFELL